MNNAIKEFDHLYNDWIKDRKHLDSKLIRAICQKWFIDGIAEQLKIENHKLREQLKKLTK